VGFFNLTDDSLNVISTWTFQKNDEPFDFSKVTLNKNAKVKSEYDVVVNADSLLVDEGSTFFSSSNQVLNIPNITVDGISFLNFSEGETINSDLILVNGGSTLTLSGGENIIADELNVAGNNSTITVLPEKILYLMIPILNVEVGSFISAYGKGYIQGGPGISPESDYSIGASYGGVGVLSTEAFLYGNAEQPLDFGTKGKAPINDSSGGGVIHLIVTDTLKNDGNISADGNVSSSGGSIYVTAKNISGIGKFTANGGGLYAGNYFAGAGGGGRVAIHYENNLFSGITETKGGCGSYDGFSMVCAGDGTVKLIDQNAIPENPPESEDPPDAPPLDTTPPVISSLSISPSPIFGYAKIGDVITLSIAADSAGYTAQTITVNNIAATNFTDNGGGTYTATYTVSQGDNDVMSGIIPASVVLSDAAGNLNVAYTTVTANNLKIDANAPMLISAEAKTSTTIDATFNEDIDGSTVNTTGSEFKVSGYAVTSAHELEGVVTLTLSSAIGVGETPNVTFESTNFKDLAGNQSINPTTIVLINNLP
jgi:hypothetical protein